MRAAAAGTAPPPAGSPFARARAIADTALQHVALVSSVAETTIKAAYKVRVLAWCVLACRGVRRCSNTSRLPASSANPQSRRRTRG